jgi:hypothetical protein
MQGISASKIPNFMHRELADLPSLQVAVAPGQQRSYFPSIGNLIVVGLLFPSLQYPALQIFKRADRHPITSAC